MWSELFFFFHCNAALLNSLFPIFGNATKALQRLNQPSSAATNSSSARTRRPTSERAGPRRLEGAFSAAAAAEEGGGEAKTGAAEVQTALVDLGCHLCQDRAPGRPPKGF